MDKETKMEILKIIAMGVILGVLIWGIVWMNSTNQNDNTQNDAQSGNLTQMVEGEQNTENANDGNT